jgi:AcrR family transcriptional regulator
MANRQSPPEHGSPARDRLLAAADELFYAEGIQTVGIDRIIEHAGVARASLYNLFGSKEGLVEAYLATRHDATTQRISAEVDRYHDPRDRLLAVFDAQGAIFSQPGFRGCAFIAACAEAPPGGLVERVADDNRAWVRALFVDLATKAGASDPGELARQLQAIYDGAGLAARMDHEPTIAVSARRAAAALLDASR